MADYLENMEKSLRYAEKLEHEAMVASVKRAMGNGNTRVSSQTIAGHLPYIRPGDTFTIENVTIPQRKWWQFWKRKSPDAGKPTTFTVVGKV